MASERFEATWRVLINATDSGVRKVSKYCLRVDVSAMDEQVPEEALVDIASVLPWSVVFAKDLNLTNAEIKCIEEDYSDDSKERVYQALRRWRESGPSEATWRALINATDSGVREVMREYVRKVHSGEDEIVCDYYPVTKTTLNFAQLECTLRKTKRNLDENGIASHENGPLKTDAKRQSTITEFYTPLKNIK